MLDALCRDLRSTGLAAWMLLGSAAVCSAAPCPPESTFAAPYTIATGLPQRYVTTADLDRDGAPDVILSTTGAIEVHMAVRGANGLEYPLTYRQPTGAGASHIAVADLDDDGLLDLAVARDGGSVLTFRGKGSAGVGDGTFEQRFGYDVGSAWDVVARDMDRDGVLDLLVTTRTGFKFLTGQTTNGVANGTFLLTKTLTTPTTIVPKGLLVTDLDDDGAPDLVFGTEREFVGIYYGIVEEAGPSTEFELLKQLSVPGAYTYDVGVADFDGDARPDIACANYLDGSVSVFPQGAFARGFESATRHPVPGGALGLAIADVDQDGRPDLLVGSPNSGGTFCVLPNEGPAWTTPDHLGAARLMGPPRTTYGLAIADLDGDQRADVLAAGLGDTLLAVFRGACVSTRLPLTTVIQGLGGRVRREPELLTYEPGAMVTLIAIDEPGAVFERWSGDATGESRSVTLTMDRPRTVTAEFRKVHYHLSIHIDGLGQVTSNPERSWYPAGAVVAIHAWPAFQQVFVEWQGDLTGTRADASLVMNSDKSITAVFAGDTRYIPKILSVLDVPDDEGGQVVLTWSRSIYEWNYPQYWQRVTAYDIWRSQAPPAIAADAPTPGGWEFVARLERTPGDEPRFFLTTANDSGASGRLRTKFFVRAQTESGFESYDSPPDSGYAVDNFAPAALADARSRVEGSHTLLSWSASAAADLSGYRVHRGTAADFAPDGSNTVAFVQATQFEAAYTGPAWYKVAAVDRNGNAGEYALFGAGVLLPGMSFGVSRIAPNPSPGGTLAVQVFLAGMERATLELFDLTGRRVDSRELPGVPGEHHVTFGEQARVRPGLYWVQLRQADRESSARAVVTH